MARKPTASITRNAIDEHLEEVLNSSGFRGSAKFSALLRYLVRASLADRTPHEIDIAVDVFGKDQRYDPAESSSVRVCVHQLRKKLDEYYAERGTDSGIRLTIPKGSYRISFGVPLIPSSIDDVSPDMSCSKPRTAFAYGPSAMWLLLSASLVANVILLLAPPGAPREEAEPAPDAWPRGSALLDLAEGSEPILIALGDFFFFRDASRYPGRTHFIRDIEINSPEDLRRFAVSSDAPSGPYGPSVRPSSMTYLPKATAFALEAILPLAQATGKPVAIKLMSEVTGEDLRRNDVIYIGFIRSMGALQNYFFQLSAFASDPPFLELHHKETGEVFAWSGDVYGQMQDYGLFSSMPGPGNGEIIVFTGIHDVGILHTVRALTDPELGHALEVGIADSEAVATAIEILFKVSGYDRTDLEATIAMTSPSLSN